VAHSFDHDPGCRRDSDIGVCRLSALRSATNAVFRSWTTLLTPGTIVITSSLVGSELDLSSPILKQIWEVDDQRRDGSNVTDITQCVQSVINGMMSFTPSEGSPTLFRSQQCRAFREPVRQRSSSKSEPFRIPDVPKSHESNVQCVNPYDYPYIFG
jgi:hypothetical protein